MNKLIIREISYYQVFKYLHTEIFHGQSLFLQIHFAIQHKDIKYHSIFGMKFLEICMYCKYQFLLACLKQTLVLNNNYLNVPHF